MTHTVGELARLTGLTTRTLHHYETLGLLRPTQRTPAGYRLYDEANVAQLHSVLAYRYLGLPLKDIAALLASDPPPLRELLARQAAVVEERVASHQRLLEALARCTRALDDGARSLDGELLGLITATRLCEESFTPDEHRWIAATKAALSPADVEALQAETAELMGKIEAARVRGADPASAPVLALMRRFLDLRQRVAGSDKTFHDKIRAIAAQAPELLRARGVTPELGQYARLAREALERVDAPPEAPTKAKAKVAAKPVRKSAGSAR
jgi:MerR family transcriptional regulator, thiopeptide resistance regulator